MHCHLNGGVSAGRATRLHCSRPCWCRGGSEAAGARGQTVANGACFRWSAVVFDSISKTLVLRTRSLGRTATAVAEDHRRRSGAITVPSLRILHATVMLIVFILCVLLSFVRQAETRPFNLCARALRLGPDGLPDDGENFAYSEIVKDRFAVRGFCWR